MQKRQSTSTASGCFAGAFDENTMRVMMTSEFTGEDSPGFTFFDAHVHGCGVVSGMAVDEAGEPFPWSGECAERVPELHEQLIREHDPDLVI